MYVFKMFHSLGLQNLFFKYMCLLYMLSRKLCNSLKSVSRLYRRGG